MRIIFDTNILVQAITGMKEGQVLTDPETGSQISDPDRRVEALIDLVDTNDGTIIIPTPVLAEYLIGIDKKEHQNHISIIQKKSCFEIASFDEIAAYECAQMPSLQELKAMMQTDTANKVKFDRQIIAIALALNVDEVWSHDKGVFRRCKELGITVKSLANITPSPVQVVMNIEHETSTGLH